VENKDSFLDSMGFIGTKRIGPHFEDLPSADWERGARESVFLVLMNRKTSHHRSAIGKVGIWLKRAFDAGLSMVRVF
jgi:hypothetical protein